MAVESKRFTTMITGLERFGSSGRNKLTPMITGVRGLEARVDVLERDAIARA